MSMKAAKSRHAWRDHIIAYLVLVVIVGVMVAGAFAVYASGVFDPVEAGSALADTEPLDLGTPPPILSSFVQWLLPSAAAEDAPVDEDGAEPEQTPAATDMDALMQELLAEADNETEITAADRITVEKGDLALNENLPDTVENYLLLATDTRDLNVSNGRSDVMIVASLDKQTNTIKLTSLSRDLYVAIPGVGNDRLNTAYAYGGMGLAVKTVNTLFELNIKGCAVVNFHMMADIVDSLGGVDIYLEPREYDEINKNVAVSEDYEGFARSSARQFLNESHQEVVVHLDGLQAVSYARIRKIDSDLQRGNRQRILLQAMMDKVIAGMSTTTTLNLAYSILRGIKTNDYINLDTAMSLSKWLLSTKGDIEMSELSIPIAGSFHNTKEKDMDVISFNLSANVQALHEFLYGAYIPATAAAE